MKSVLPPRRFLKWAGAVLSVLLLAGWVASSWYQVGWTRPTHVAEVGAARGALGISHWRWLKDISGPSVNPAQTRGAYLKSTSDTSYYWWFQFGRTSALNGDVLIDYIVIPLWAPLLGVSAFTAAIWRKDHILTSRRLRGRCLNCGYNRDGLDPACNCPECGFLIA